MRWIALCVLAGLLTFGNGVCQAGSPRPRQVTFDIQAQPLRSALQEFARQTGMQVLRRDEVTSVEGKTAPRLTGVMPVREALEKLLSNTGLQYEFVNERTVILVSPPTQDGKISSVQWSQTATSEQPGGGSLPAPPPPREAASDTSSASGQSSAPLSTVVVTAQRRAERLENVPMSMSVLGGSDLDGSTAQGMTELLGRVPGVSTSVAAGAAGTLVAVRGVTAPSSFNAGPSPIGYYLDSVPFGFVRMATVPDLNVYDLDRVEVLRGPQGTLYGAGSQNGVVRVLTHDADLDRFEFKGRSSYSHTETGSDSYRGDVAFNAPIVPGKLGVRVVLGYQSLSGWIDKPTRADANDSRLRNARLKLNAQPTDQLSIAVSAWFSRSDYGAPSSSSDNRVSPNPDVEQITEDFDTYGLKVSYDFDAFSITSNTSYLKYANEGALDTTASGIPGGRLRTRVTPDTFAEEMYVNSRGDGPWRWTAGGMYRDGEDRLYQTLTPIFSFPQTVNFISKSWAAFGELTRVFLDGRVEVTAGLRHFEDNVSTHEESRLGNGPQPAQPIERETHFSANTPRVIVNFHPPGQGTIYVSYAEGFRSGFDQLPSVLAAVPAFPSVQPDRLKNYEIGAKGSFFGGRFSYDSAVYYMDWRDVQLPLLVLVNGVNRSGAVNGPSASGEGIDLALTASPVAGLQLGVNFSWNNLAVDEQVFSGGVLLIDKGDRLNMSPKYTAGAMVGYSFGFSSGYTAQFALSGNLTSRLDVAMLAGTTRTVTHGDRIGVGRANFSINSPSKWSAMLYVDNITNEQGAVTRGFAPVFWPRVRPRTYGLQVDYRF